MNISIEKLEWSNFGRLWSRILWNFGLIKTYAKLYSGCLKYRLCIQFFCVKTKKAVIDCSSKKLNFSIEGSVSEVSSDPPCKDGNAPFTTIPLKALSDQVGIGYPSLFFFKLLISICVFSAKVACAFFFALKNHWRNWQK